MTQNTPSTGLIVPTLGVATPAPGLRAPGYGENENHNSSRARNAGIRFRDRIQHQHWAEHPRVSGEPVTVRHKTKEKKHRIHNQICGH